MSVHYDCETDNNFKTDYTFDQKTECEGTAMSDKIEFMNDHKLDCHNSGGFIQRFHYDRDWTDLNKFYQGCINWPTPGGDAGTQRTTFWSCYHYAKSNGFGFFVFGNIDGDGQGDCYRFNAVSHLSDYLTSDSNCNITQTDGYDVEARTGGTGNNFAVYQFIFGECVDGMSARYTCREGFPTNCSIHYTDCNSWEGRDMEYLDRHDIDCPAGKMLSYVKAEQFNPVTGAAYCSPSSDGRFVYFCCEPAEVSRLQAEADHWCRQEAGDERPIARKDFGNDSQRTAEWRCYGKEELMPDEDGDLNCVDNCNNPVNCAGKVYGGVSENHYSRNIELTAFLQEKASETCNSSAPTTAPTMYPTYEEGTEARNMQIAGEAVGLRCNDVTININHYWQEIGKKAHVEDPGDGVYRLSVKGGARASVNIALTDKNATGEQFSGVDVFIGSDDEPVVHISEDVLSAPLAFASIADDRIFNADSFTEVWIKVDGDTVSVGKGAYNAQSTPILSHTLSSSKVMNKAVVTYGYGDYECETMA